MKANLKTKGFTHQNFLRAENLGGFTLIETLVAISILLTAVVAPLTIASRSISYTNFARDQIIASYLAFDALETIIAMRDYNVANGVGWDDGLSCPSGACRIDTSYTDMDDISLVNCVEDNKNPNPPAATCYLDINSTGLYGYQDGVQTQFQRIIDVENISVNGNNDEKHITSRVKFRTGVLTREFSLKLNLFNTGI